MIKFGLFLIIIFISYTIIPNYYYRNISKNIVKRIHGNKEIALTFDDGPDEVYTPILLDLLGRYNVKASFFLVANKVLRNKDVFYRIINEGHAVGIHSLNHRSAWLSLPITTRRDFKESVKIFNKMGVNIKYFRPPWGTFNIVTQYNANKNGLKTILWSLDAKDWSRRTTSDYIKDKIVNSIKSGDIIVLHDSNGAKGAPARMIEALEEIIPQLKKKGYTFVTIEEKIGGAESEKVDTEII